MAYFISLICEKFCCFFSFWSASVNLLLGYQKELAWQEEDTDKIALA